MSLTFSNRQSRKISVVGMVLGVGVVSLGALLAVPSGSKGVQREFVPEVAPLKAGIGAGEPQVNVFVTADWGEPGPALSAVGKAMGERAGGLLREGRPLDAVFLAGDNFYEHLKSTSDPAWEALFEKGFPKETLDCPFYVTLGNQDYEEGKDGVELAYAAEKPGSRWEMPSRWYRKEFSAEGKAIASVLFLDSDVTGLGPSRFAEETRWIEEELAKPRVAPWLVVVAHHPLITGEQARPTELMLSETWKPMFVAAGVNLYVHGHQHQLARALAADTPKMNDITVGGGGAQLRVFKAHASTIFKAQSYGYAHLTLTPTAGNLEMRDDRNRVLHVAVLKP